MKPGKRHRFNRLDTGSVEGECYYDLPSGLRKLIDETILQHFLGMTQMREPLAKLVIRAIYTDRKAGE